MVVDGAVTDAPVNMSPFASIVCTALLGTNPTVEFPKIITGCKPLVVPPAEQNDSPFRPRSSASMISFNWLWNALLILLAVQ